MIEARKAKKKEGLLKKLFTGLNKRPLMTFDEHYGIILKNTIAQSNAKILIKEIKKFSAKNKEIINKSKLKQKPQDCLKRWF